MATTSQTKKHPPVAKRAAVLAAGTGGRTVAHGVERVHLVMLDESHRTQRTGPDVLYEIRRTDDPRSKMSIAIGYVGTPKSGRRIERVPPGSGHEAWASEILAVLAQTVQSFSEAQKKLPAAYSESDLFREVGTVMAEMAGGSEQNAVADNGWQDLLERGIKAKTALLRSKEFKSSAEASELVGIGEPAIRRRIREGKLFALRMSEDSEHRIPAWALDFSVMGQATSVLLERAQGMNEWALYHFLATANGYLNGLRPFECLLSLESLPRAKQAVRDGLAERLKLPLGRPLLEPVLQALKYELEEGAGA